MSADKPQDLTADEQSWFDALAGRRPDADDPAAQEGRAVREMVLARAATEDSPMDAPDPSRERQLIERARREGLIPPARLRPRLTGLAAAAVFGLALVAGVALWRSQTPHTPQETTRSGPGDIVRLEAADPAALQREILSGLSTCGVEATGYERLGLRGVDADLPRPPSDCLALLLARHHIAPPPDGVLRVEIGARPQP